MKPIKFNESNVTLAKDQKPYLPLPVYRDDGGTVTSCWKLTWIERFQIFVTGKIFISMRTFGMPAMPIRPSLNFRK